MAAVDSLDEKPSRHPNAGQLGESLALMLKRQVSVSRMSGIARVSGHFLSDVRTDVPSSKVAHEEMPQAVE